MSREHPLDERRAGARHADDEDRLLGREAAPRAHPARRERLANPLDGREIAREVVLEVSPAQPRTGRQMLPGARVLAQVLVLLGERVAQWNLALPDAARCAER